MQRLKLRKRRAEVYVEKRRLRYSPSVQYTHSLSHIDIKVMTFDTQGTPEKGKGKNKTYKSKSNISDESDGYAGSALDGSAPSGSDGDDGDSAYVAAKELRALAQNSEKKRKTQTNNEDHASTSRQSAPIPGQPDDADLCSMCGLDHQGTECYMTASSEHLVEYRKILMDPECGPIEPRVRCVFQALCPQTDMVVLASGYRSHRRDAI